MTADALRTLLERLGDLPYGLELVSQREHALQCAGLAIEAGADDELVLACALHDAGYALAFGDARTPHETLGARFVRDSIGERAGALVLGHVDAKRFLVAEDPDYALSPASIASLARQGGPMPEREREAFRSHPYFSDMLALRRWDDRAKVPGAAAPEIDEIVERFIRFQSRPRA